MGNNVYINGIGLVSKYGNTLREFWTAIQSPESCNNLTSKLDAVRCEESSAGYEQYFIHITTEAIASAVKDAQIQNLTNCGCIILGTGMGLSDAFLEHKEIELEFLSQIKEKLKKRFKEQMKSELDIVIIANACCAGAEAIAYGYDLIHSSKYSYVIAGGTEIYSEITKSGFLRLNALDKTGCKPFDRDRKGTYVGEGAAFFVLQKEKKPNSYVELLGHAVTNDSYHIVSPDPSGRYAGNAIQKVMEGCNVKPCEIDAIIAHGTGTKLNDRIEAETLGKIFKGTDVTAPKGKIGHTGGASGAFGLLTAIGMFCYQEIPPVINLIEPDENIKINVIRDKTKKKLIRKVLINCFAFGGTNTILLCGYIYNNMITVKKRIKISEEDFKNSLFSPSGSRTMDEFTKKILYTVNELFEGDLSGLNSNRTGVALSTKTGPYSSLVKIAKTIREDGYQAINPSFFPNVMLSTPLSQLAIYCKVHGPSCAFYDNEGQGKDAFLYCENQIDVCNCDAMILVSADEWGYSEGSYITRKDL